MGELGVKKRQRAHTAGRAHEIDTPQPQTPRHLPTERNTYGRSLAGSNPQTASGREGPGAGAETAVSVDWGPRGVGSGDVLRAAACALEMRRRVHFAKHVLSPKKQSHSPHA